MHENVDALQSNALQVVKLHAKLLLSKSDYIKNLDSSKREQIKSQIRIADMRLGHINSTKGFLYEDVDAFERLLLPESISHPMKHNAV